MVSIAPSEASTSNDGLAFASTIPASARLALVTGGDVFVVSKRAAAVASSTLRGMLYSMDQLAAVSDDSDAGERAHP